jgi:hypothetical protein
MVKEVIDICLLSFFVGLVVLLWFGIGLLIFGVYLDMKSNKKGSRNV